MHMAGTVPGQQEDGVARNTRSSALESRSARLKLPKKRGKPVWVRIDRGLSLGYRRIETAGPWIVRKATGNGGNWIKNFAHADDFEASNGDSVLTFFEAQAIARTIARGGEASGGLITVATAIERYERDLATRGGRAYNARLARIHLPPALLGKPVGLLTIRDLRGFRDGLLKGRTAGTVNRVISVLRAALELAAATDPRITNVAAFKVGLKKLPDAARARNVVLTDDQVRRVVELAYGEGVEFGRLIETLATTGARRSQVARLTVADLQDGRAPRLMLPSSLKGKGVKRIDRKPVPIPTSLAATLQQAAGDRPDEALLLLKPAGSAWGASDLRASFRRVVERALLDPDVVTAYSLRHSSITRQLLRGVPIRVVAASHDTSVPMIEKSYSAAIGDHSDALHRSALLDLGGRHDDKVVPLARKG
jgi:integrase